MNGLVEWAVGLRALRENIDTITPGGRLEGSSSLTRFANDGWSVHGSLKAAVEQLPAPTGTDFVGGVMLDEGLLTPFAGLLTTLGRVGDPDDIH